MPKSLKEKTKKTDNITATADLKFDYDNLGYLDDERHIRQIVNKVKFNEFIGKYNKTQNEATEKTPKNTIEYNIKVKIKHIDTGKFFCKRCFPTYESSIWRCKCY